MKTLRLTDLDYNSLVMMCGYVAGAHGKEDEVLPQSWKNLSDWILIQGDEGNYTYYNDKNTLRETKEKELAND